MPQGNGFDQVLIQAKESAHRPGNFGHKLHMEYPVSYMIISDHVKDLGLVNISGVGLGMQNPVGIKGKRLPMTCLALTPTPHPIPAQGGKSAEMILFKCIKSCFEVKQPRQFIRSSVHVLVSK